jgi:hypothetical protein
MGIVKMYWYSLMNLSTYFYCVENHYAEVVDVTMNLFSP